MKKFEIYKDVHNKTIYLINNTFYVNQKGMLETAPKFLQTWYSKWIEEKREDLIIKTNFLQFNNTKTK
jgi:hypothetical protein